MQPVSGDGKFACSHAHGTNKIGIASNHDIQQGLELPQVSNSPLGLLLFYPVFNLGIFGHFWGYGHDFYVETGHRMTMETNRWLRPLSFRLAMDD